MRNLLEKQLFNCTTHVNNMLFMVIISKNHYPSFVFWIKTFVNLSFSCFVVICIQINQIKLINACLTHIGFHGN